MGDDRVFVVRADGSLHAVAGSDGSTVWTRGLDGRSWEPPAVADGVVYVAGSNGRRLRALDAETGDERWSYEHDVGYGTAPAVAGDTVYEIVDDGSGYLFALDAETGEKRWRRDLGVAPKTGPVVGSGRIYYGAANGGGSFA